MNTTSLSYARQSSDRPKFEEIRERNDNVATHYSREPRLVADLPSRYLDK